MSDPKKKLDIAKYEEDIQKKVEKQLMITLALQKYSIAPVSVLIHRRIYIISYFLIRYCFRRKDKSRRMRYLLGHRTYANDESSL